MAKNLRPRPRKLPPKKKPEKQTPFPPKGGDFSRNENDYFPSAVNGEEEEEEEEGEGAYRAKEREGWPRREEAGRKPVCVGDNLIS